MNIDQTKQFLEYIARKNNSATLSPSQLNLILDRAQMQKFMELFGNPQEYQVGNPVPRVAYEVTQKISDDLRTFKEEKNVILDNGRAVLPEDYIHALTISAIVGKNTKDGVKKIYTSFDIVDEDKEVYRISSNIVPPTKEFPIAVLKKDYFQIYPEDLTNVKISYLRRPKMPIWGYTVQSGRPVYDPSQSTDLEWPEQTVNDIIIRACNYIGISIKDGDILGYTQGKIQTGM